MSKDKSNRINVVIDNFPMSERMLSCNMTITGTFLLYLYGLADNFKDVDIIVDDIDVIESEINKLVKLHKNIERVDDFELFCEDYESIKIEHNGIKYNFLQEDLIDIESDITYLTLDKYITDEIRYSFELDTLNHALKAKMWLNRHKDKDCLIKIAQNILKYND